MKFFSAFLKESGDVKPATKSEESTEEKKEQREIVIPVIQKKFMSKESLSRDLKEISDRGWIQNTIGKKDSAAGDLLEHLLNIPTNNLAIADTGVWELKTQRINSSALVSLSHKEPQPKAIIPKLVKAWGWRHKEAGRKYPEDEKSLRLDMAGDKYNGRGFKIIVDREKQKILVDYNPSMVKEEYKAWAESIDTNSISMPYWDLSSLYLSIGRKFYNCFFVIADVKEEGKIEYFHYKSAYILENVSIDKFVECLTDGTVIVEIDARTRHNHGTKFRMYFKDTPKVYKKVVKIF